MVWKFYFTCFFFPRGLSGRKLLTVAGGITSGFPAPYFWKGELMAQEG